MNEHYRGNSKKAMAARQGLAKKGLKYCGKCDKVKPYGEFSSDKARWDGLNTKCKECERAHYEANKEKRNEQKRAYREANKEKISEHMRAYYESNKEKLSEQKRAYYESPASYDTYASQIGYAEPGIQCGPDGELMAPCAYCGRMHVVIASQAHRRAGALNGTRAGECRLYCTTACKKACPIYGQRKYYRGQKVDNSSREVQPELRQMCLARDDYTCQKCGAHGDKIQLHCHHIKSVVDDPIESADVDNTITLCKKCHKAVHKKIGCRYQDLKCNSKHGEE